MKRWKKWVLRGALALVIVPTVSLVVDRSLTRSRGEARLAEVVSRLDADDPGWRLDNIVATREAKFPPDDQNVMSLVRRIHPRVPDVYKEWSQHSADWLPKPDLNRLPDPAAAAEAKRVRTACLDVIKEARRAQSMTSPGGYHLDVKPNVLGTLLEPTQNLREIAALLALDAVVSALSGDRDPAVTSTHALLNAARGLGDEPFLISVLVRIACATIAKQTAERVLALGEPRNGLPELQETFAAESGEPLLTAGLKGERASFDKLFENLDTGQTDLGEVSGSRGDSLTTSQSFGWWVYRSHLPEDRAYYLETMTRLIDISRKPPHERKALFDREDDAFRAAAQANPRDRRHLLTNLLMPAWTKVADADIRNKANLRSAAAGIACERFRQANGRWPNDLAEIPKALLPELPLDPYDGQPFRFRRTGDGVLVYAVGPDKADDGGNLTTGNPEPGQDIGFRLWDPERRRAAPLPKPKDVNE